MPGTVGSSGTSFGEQAARSPVTANNSKLRLMVCEAADKAIRAEDEEMNDLNLMLCANDLPSPYR
jgi:hypothetical protein